MASVFGDYGQMLSCFLLHKLSAQGQISGFVRYASGRGAVQALAAVEGGQISLNGGIVRARWASENCSRFANPHQPILKQPPLRSALVIGSWRSVLSA